LHATSAKLAGRRDHDEPVVARARNGCDSIGVTPRNCLLAEQAARDRELAHPNACSGLGGDETARAAARCVTSERRATSASSGSREERRGVARCRPGFPRADRSPGRRGPAPPLTWRGRHGRHPALEQGPPLGFERAAAIADAAVDGVDELALLRVELAGAQLPHRGQRVAQLLDARLRVGLHERLQRSQALFDGLARLDPARVAHADRERGDGSRGRRISNVRWRTILRRPSSHGDGGRADDRFVAQQAAQILRHLAGGRVAAVRRLLHRLLHDHLQVARHVLVEAADRLGVAGRDLVQQLVHRAAFERTAQGEHSRTARRPSE
jgi:hypothetical protein